MNEVTCPNCGKAFKVDEAGFANLLKQVRDDEFDRELHQRMELLEKDKQTAIQLAREKTKNEHQAESASKDTELAELKSRLQALQNDKKTAINLATERIRNELTVDIAKREAEYAELKNHSEARIKELETEKLTEFSRLKSEKELAVMQLESRKEAETAELKARLQTLMVEKQSAVNEAMHKAEKQRDELASELKNKDMERQLLESSLKDRYEIELRTKDETIAFYKDMKTRLSTKMVGETLEQHCEIEFERLRATGFKNAQFGKDNDASSGSKGDYIYRDFDDEGNEIISIMFEMKNESDQTSSKKTNDAFLKELHKDRIEKKCEYAVLVSLLEADNELYNAGIIDVSHRHDKMYVVRPQFFIPIITVLRNAAINSMKYRSELALIRSQNIDITNFESELQLFQDGFMKNVKDSSNKFQEAMDGIDSTIKKLESVKEALRLSNKHLLTAGNKVESVSVKRLTNNNPTMAAKFSEVNRAQSDDSISNDLHAPAA